MKPQHVQSNVACGLVLTGMYVYVSCKKKKKKSYWCMGIMINGGRECLVTLMNWDELFCSHKKMRRFLHLKIKQFDYMLSWLLV